MDSAKIHITGIVQGVGFRPFVYNLAMKFGLNGYCLNDSEGVVIEVSGSRIDTFIEELKNNAPPLSRIETLTVEEIKDSGPYKDFSIKESVPVEGKFVLVSPDISICGDCLKELLDPSDRRHLYPFINCTNCGPRYSIVKDIPYDRPRTTMAPFTLCPECDKEYHDPANRRFHAQPNACAKCGPRVWLAEKGTVRPSGPEVNFDAVKKAQALLKGGAVLAIKGLGGFHLACDAGNDEAVTRLRSNKRKSYQKGGGSNKPFALMSPDIGAVRDFAHVSGPEEDALKDRTRPIVLLKKRLPNSLSAGVAPNNGYYGVMLPYTPLHYLLFSGSGFTALVMTSGNLSEEPIVTSNDEAASKLSHLADYFLLHDREIYMRVDDSILRAEDGRRVIRRARGFTPSPIDLGEEMEDMLACGAELKNTFCLTKGAHAILSQHIGDLENHEALEFYKESLRNLKNTFKAAPVIVAHDMHPDYLSTKFAIEYAAENNITGSRIIPVQHHHAHVVSVVAEHGLNGKVIGVAFDGTGYGTDNNIWGSEFMVADRRSFKRAAHLSYIRLPGGDAAIKEPWRTALSYLHHTFGGDAPGAFEPFYNRLDPKEAGIILKMIKSGFNSPLTSGMGRLFDAIASLIGLRDSITFEAEAAIELEHIADEDAKGAYPFGIIDGAPLRIDSRPMVRAIIEDLKNGAQPPCISGRFHRTLAEMILAVVIKISNTGIKDVILSGGVFQNGLLLKLAKRLLEGRGFTVWTNGAVPANDGGISLGQAAIAWEMVKGGR